MAFLHIYKLFPDKTRPAGDVSARKYFLLLRTAQIRPLPAQLNGFLFRGRFIVANGSI